MFKKSFIIVALVLASVLGVRAQNANTPARRPAPPPRQQTTTTTTAPTPTPTPNTTRTRRATSPTRAAATGAEQEVRATFDALLRAVEKTDVEAVMNFYWNSPQLLIFNNNGTVTRGWTQMRANLASLYPDLKNVKIEARDAKVQTFGTDGAALTCLWTQTQEFRGTPETSSGRMTVLFRHVGGAWKITHRHTSPEAPDPSRLPASEQSAPAAPKTTATPPPNK
jgi:ketosteroid isomerase-like protein